MGIQQSLAVVSGFLSLTMLGGCLTSDDPKGPTKIGITTEAEVLSIVVPVADSGKAGVVSTTSTSYSCVDGEAEEYDYPQTYKYAITGGFLYLWKSTDCTAMKFSGTSSKIQGTWTSSDLSARIPSKYRPAICDTATLKDNDYEVFLKDASVTYTITSSKIKGEVKGGLCYGAALAEQFKDYEDVSIVSSDCATVKMKNDEVGRTATYTVTLKGEKLTQTLVYNGKTCKVTTPATLDQTKEPTCSEEEDEAYAEASEEFQDCLEESEFPDDFKEASAPKTSSEFRTPLERALKHALPF